MANETVSRRINIYIETGAAQKEFDRLNAKAEALTKELASTTDKSKVKELQKQLAALAGPLDVAKKKLSGELAPSMRELQKVVNDLGNRMKRMSTTDADFSTVLRQYSQAKAQLEAVKDEVKKVEQAHQNIGNTNPFSKVLDFAKGAFLGGALLNLVQGAIGGITNFIKGSFDEAFQADEMGARLKGTLDNLGRSDAFARITAKADEIAAHFKYLDNDDVVGVFNKLIDYGKLTEKQMNDLLPVIVNFAAKQRISLEEATTAIVGGLEGQGKALKQYGINIKDGGDSAERLGIIMTTLKDKVQGAGEAFSKDAAGGAAEAKQEFKNLQEDIGTGLLPALNTVMAAISKGITGIRFLFGQVKSESQQEYDRQTAALDKVQIDERLEKANKLIAERKHTIDEIIASQEAALAKTSDEQQKRILQGTIDALNQKKFANKTLGNAPPEVDKDAEAAAKKAAEKRATEAQKILDDQQKLAEELKKIRAQLTVANESEMDKELAAAVLHFQDLSKLAHGNADLLKQLETALQDDMLAIMVKFGRKQTEEFTKQQEAERRQREAEHNKIVAQMQQQAIRLAEEQKKSDNLFGRNNVASIELDLLKAHGTQKLELNKRLLAERMRQELANEDLTQKERELIIEQYNKQAEEMERNHWQNVAAIMLEFVGQALQVLDQFGQAQTAKENAQLESDRQANDKKKGNFKRQLDNKQITQQDYNQKVADLDKAQEKKEHDAKVKQFKREQRTSIANALIGGAQAAQKTLAEWGMPFAIPWLALTAASTIAQIAIITSQKAPEFAKGGLLNGPSHKSKSNGMPVINPQTNQVQAYLEGGEAVTNKRTMADGNHYTVSGTPSQIVSSLNALHGGVSWAGGATLVPRWKTVTPQRMNFEGINQSFRTVRMFENGGVFDGATVAAAGSGATPGFDPIVFENLVALMAQLNGTLQNGVTAYMPLTHFEDQTARKQAIIDAATLR